MLPFSAEHSPGVRLATDADRAVIAAIHYGSWHNSYADVAPPSVVTALSAVAVEQMWSEVPLASAEVQVHVATAGATVVGFAAVDLSSAQQASIEALFVDPLHQRAGHASRLVADVAQQARAANVAVLQSWIPAVDAPRLQFFAQTGMAATGRRSLNTEVAGEEPMVELLVSASL